MITQPPSTRTDKYRQKTQTPSGNKYFFNSQRKLNIFNAKSAQSISYQHSQIVSQYNNSPELKYPRREEFITPFSNAFIELYDEFENNYKLVQKIKTDLDISVDLKDQKKQNFTSTQSQSSIKAPTTTLTRVASLEIQDIDQELNQRIQISRFKFYYFRQPISKRPSPLSLTISFETQINSSQFKLYLSTIHEFPTKFNAEHNLTSNYCKIYTSSHENIFEENYLYITFYSEIDITTKIKIVFGQIQLSKSPQKQIIKKEYPKFPGLNVSIRTDLIKRNLDTSQFSILKKPEIMAGFFSEREVKRKLVLQKNKEITTELKLQKKTNLNAQMLRNDYRLFEKIYKLRLHKKYLCQLFWIQVVNLSNFAFQLRSQLILFKRRTSNRANGRLRALRYASKLLIEVRKMGPNAERRSFCKSLMAVSMFAGQIQIVRKQKAQSIATAFIRECLSIIHLAHRLLKTRHYVIVLQNKFRFFQRQKKRFNTDIWILIQSNYKEIIRGLAQQSQKQKNRSTRQVYIYQIDQQMMQFQVDNYYQRQKTIWLSFIRQKIQDRQLDSYLNDRKSDEIRKALIKFQEPRLFQLPQINEIAELIELYAKQKRMI